MDDFLHLLTNSNNNLVWGAMIALSNIAHQRADDIFEYLVLVKRTIEKDSVITMDSGIIVLSKIAASNKHYNRIIFPLKIRIII